MLLFVFVVVAVVFVVGVVAIIVIVVVVVFVVVIVALFMCWFVSCFLLFLLVMRSCARPQIRSKVVNVGFTILQAGYAIDTKCITKEKVIESCFKYG